MGQFTNSEGYALNTVAALGADIDTTVGGDIVLTGGFTFKISDIVKSQRKVRIVPYVAAVARVTTLTFTAPAAVGESYLISYEQPQADGGVQKGVIAFASVAGDTNATVAQRAKDIVDGYIAAGVIAATTGISTNVLTVRATAAAPMLRFVSATANVALLATTSGNPAAGTAAQLAALNIEGLVSTNNYNVYYIPVASKNLSATEDGTYFEFIYCVNAGSANAASFTSKAADIFAGYIGNDSPNLNPHMITLL